MKNILGKEIQKFRAKVFEKVISFLIMRKKLLKKKERWVT